MAKTNAERQADYRRRKAEGREEIRRSALAEITGRFETAFRALETENERLRSELGRLARPCSAHRQSAEFISQCRRCGQ